MRTRRKGSSADSGSSSRRICGSVMSARASATRCCCPPDNCAGTRCGVGVHRDEFQESIAFLRRAVLVDAAHLQREGDIVDAGQMREQRIALKHHRRAALGRRQVGDVVGADQDVALRGALVAGDHAQASRSCRSRTVRAGSNSSPALTRKSIASTATVDAIALGQFHEFEIAGIRHSLTNRQKGRRTKRKARASRDAATSPAGRWGFSALAARSGERSVSGAELVGGVVYNFGDIVDKIGAVQRAPDSSRAPSSGRRRHCRSASVMDRLVRFFARRYRGLARGRRNLRRFV